MSLRNTRLADLAKRIGEPVTVHAWITHLRSSGKIAFAVLRDGSGVAQAVIVKTQVTPDVWAAFQELTLETSVGSTRTPDSPSTIWSWMPPTRLATTGRAFHIASATVRPKPSPSDF